MILAFHRVCLLLGSNIQPERNIPLAIYLLKKQVKVTRTSSTWESAAVGSNGPNMLNAAVMINTSLDLADLKEKLVHPLENQLGRVRTQDKNAPRTIDIDIILYDKQVVEPALWEYAFRAVPVAQLAPELLSADGETLIMVAQQLAKSTPIWIRKDVVI